MQLKHSFTVPAGIEETWAALNDIESVGACFPGAQVTSVEGDTFEGTVKVKLGPIAMVYKGTGTFTDKDESAHRMVLDAKGKDKRGNGTAGADVVVTMSEAGGGTDVDVTTDLNITGKPAQFGRGVMQDVSDKLLGQFVECLKTKVGDSGTASGAGASDGGDDAGESAAAVVPDGEAASGGAAAPVVVSDGDDAGESSAPKPVATAPPVSAPEQDDAIDLGATVLPVLAKAYWKQALAGAVGVAVVVWVITKLV